MVRLLSYVSQSVAQVRFEPTTLDTLSGDGLLLLLAKPRIQGRLLLTAGHAGYYFLSVPALCYHSQPDVMDLPKIP